MNLYEYFYINSNIRAKLIDKELYKNIYQLPHIDKVIVELSTSPTNEEKLIESIYSLELITGKKPAIIKARRSEAAFKLREGQYIGAKVTLRSLSALSFLLYLSEIVLYRIPDIKMLSTKSLTNKNNNSFSFGIDDISKFPEIEYEYENIKSKSGLNIHIAFNTGKLTYKKTLLSLLGLGINKSV